MVSVRNPLYVVQKFIPLGVAPITTGEIEYYSTFESEKMWTPHLTDAFLFTSLLNASRVAEAENAEIRVLVFPAEAKLFGVENVEKS